MAYATTIRFHITNGHTDETTSSGLVNAAQDSLYDAVVSTGFIDTILSATSFTHFDGVQNRPALELVGRITDEHVDIERPTMLTDAAEDQLMRVIENEAAVDNVFEWTGAEL